MAMVTVVGIRLCPASSIGLLVCPRGAADVPGLFQDAVLTGKQFIWHMPSCLFGDSPASTSSAYPTLACNKKPVLRLQGQCLGADMSRTLTLLTTPRSPTLGACSAACSLLAMVQQRQPGIWQWELLCRGRERREHYRSSAMMPGLVTFLLP